ncbi:ankyrin repeat domain-containing protein [Leptospira biflexa]|uniref:ankyrin repeat domain-containing protein n=1 Tax=Leptospira biflexa TaxID=172 RepID=UPI001082E737|nr:ankyrin repeat domain-containing protein [Leptospira biflexa]TGM34796.1 ankyrin repeat domain-containing protein [Leptospira biflexa]TGM42311.1 ankyrin repeat domain-containing protein [Leptospira biflexa]
MKVPTMKPFLIFKKIQLPVFLILLCIHPRLLFSQSKDMVKLEWYHYILLSPVLIIDGIKKGYAETKKNIQEYQTHQSLPELHKAVIQSDYEKTKSLVESGVHLETIDTKGATALFYAIELNRINIARFLITKNANVNVSNFQGRPAALSAIKNNQFDLVKMMLDHGLNLQNPKTGDTLLTIACAFKPTNFKLVQLLIERGVAINAKDKNHYSALMHLTTREEPNLDIIRYTIKKGADVNAKDQLGRSILRLLVEARTQNLTLVQILLENGADLYAKDNEGKTIFDFINAYYDSPKTDDLVLLLKRYKKKR